MTFSIRTFLIVIAVLSVWLGALVSRSPLFVELAAGGTVLLILLSLALAIWEPRPLLRAFWTGFFALAFGNLLYNGFFHSYQRTSNQVAQVIMGNYQPPTYGPGPYTPGSMPNGVISFPARTALYAPEDEYVNPAPPPPTGAPVSDSANSASETSPGEIPANPNGNSNPQPRETAEPEWEMSGPGTGPYSAPMPAPAPYVWQPVAPDYHEQREAIQASVPPLISLLMGVVGGCVTMWIAAQRKDDDISAKVA